MTDSMRKRAWAGEPHREARQRDPGPLKLPPHKKPRVWRLKVNYVRTTSETCVKDFASKAAMQEFRARVERALKAEEAKPPRSWWRWFGGLHTTLKMESTEHHEFRSPPVITEELIDG